ncbi:MAG TPA: Rpn family recombination-promoting nuclease/putative transposase [Polyangiaceae bacterium]|nr:Rpn family recombination-promoting nuclease/putative transposase [Polyangiaceae bacterium]
MSHVPTPHNALFKRVFGDPANAASELQQVLPADVAALIDWPSLELCAGSFVDPQLAERHTDLLFSARFAGRKSHIYVLFEHQSAPDRFMPFRLLRYLIRIWEAFLRDNPTAKQLPAIIPVVLYHSEQAGGAWSGPTRLSELIDLEPATLAAFTGLIPELRFVLDDISRLDDADLRKRTLTAAITLFLLRDARSSGNLLAGLKRWARVLAKIAEAPNGLEALAALLEYALRVGDVPRQDLETFVRQLGPVTTEAYMTTAEMIAKEGEARGEARGKAELVLRLLTLRFGALPQTASARVASATSEELDLFAERVLTASTVEEVLS